MTTAQAKFMEAYKAATTLHAAGRLQEARARYEALLKSAPHVPELPFQLGRIALAERDPEGARAHLERARALKPEEPAILSALAEALAALDRTEEALALYDAAIKAKPKAVKPRADKALLLQRIGDFARAETEFRRALKRAPKDGELYRIFLATQKLTKGDPLIRDMRAAWKDPSVQGRGRIHLGFALAKAMEDSGQSDEMFPFLDAANAALHRSFPYDAAARDQEVDGLIAAFRSADFTPISDGPREFAPIFVTGLPRSGTTLVEQIIAAHPEVQSGGEMRHGLALAYDAMGQPGAFSRLEALDPQRIAEFATAYEARVRRQHRFDTWVTDKGIQSHLIIGLLRKALPRARVIVVRRDPRALGFSIYKNVFAEGTHRYNTRLEDIADYVVSFERIIDFWREALPDGFTEVRYEDLVADPETQTRRLIDAAGLSWDPACLTFHAHVGRVETLSVAQVREPIHGRSARGWERHAEDLAPLIRRLEERGVTRDVP